MLESLKEKVYNANMDLVKNGLVLYTWGNVSAIDREKKLVIIKPSGVKYDDLKASDMVVIDLNGNIIEGQLNPSSDTPTHLELYKNCESIGGIAHTHSSYATAFAQAGKEIVAYGTTHADYFFGNIPCARSLTENELEEGYEKNTGKVLLEAIDTKSPLEIPASLIKNHGVFAWGIDADNAVYNATVLEEIAKMAFLTQTINKETQPIPKFLLKKHYNRKHGKNAYYGQGEKK